MLPSGFLNLSSMFSYLVYYILTFYIGVRESRISKRFRQENLWVIRSGADRTFGSGSGSSCVLQQPAGSMIIGITQTDYRNTIKEMSLLAVTVSRTLQLPIYYPYCSRIILTCAGVFLFSKEYLQYCRRQLHLLMHKGFSICPMSSLHHSH